MLRSGSLEVDFKWGYFTRWCYFCYTVPEQGGVGSTAFLRFSSLEFDRLAPLFEGGVTTQGEFLRTVEGTVTHNAKVQLICTKAIPI